MIFMRKLLAHAQTVATRPSIKEGRGTRLVLSVILRCVCRWLSTENGNSVRLVADPVRETFGNDSLTNSHPSQPLTNDISQPSSLTNGQPSSLTNGHPLQPSNLTNGSLTSPGGDMNGNSKTPGYLSRILSFLNTYSTLPLFILYVQSFLTPFTLWEGLLQIQATPTSWSWCCVGKWGALVPSHWNPSAPDQPLEPRRRTRLRGQILGT